MKASEISLYDFFNGTKQFIIPIYQRNYSWQRKHCEQLWKDIVLTAADEQSSGHFLGSVVYISKGRSVHISTVPQLLVIDGQQRLTTISLFLLALIKRFESQAEIAGMTKEQIRAHYLVNSLQKEDLRYKILLTRRDKETYTNLVEGKELSEDPSKRLIENYQFFEEQLKKTDLDLNRLFIGLSKIFIVDISLDYDHDNPQRIFESLNSTGLDLSQADQIRNYILMGLNPEEQREIYDEYWYRMEKSFGQTDNISLFDRFVRDYLTMKLGRIPVMNEVYDEFKRYAHSMGKQSIKDLVTDIYHYSKYFVNIARELEPDKELKAVFADINTLKVDVAYPFLLELYEDYKNGKLSKTEFIEILKLIESYVFRRAICGIPTNSLNKTFATISREIEKKYYLESIRAVFQLKDSYRRFPADVEFIYALQNKDVYHFRNRNYLLGKLENYDTKEPNLVVNYTIEHIMPQNPDLSEKWKQDLGKDWVEVQKKYLHTLGNLTLTAYNSDMSDRPFQEKISIKGGFKESGIRLNVGLAQLTTWNEHEIIQRGKRLAYLAAKVWVNPNLPQDVLDRYRKTTTDTSEENTYTLADHPFITDSVAELFEALRKRILNLDAEVKEEILKIYIAYKTTTNFVDVVPQKSRLRLTLNVKFGELQDPKGLSVDVSNKGRWGNGEVECYLSSMDQIDDIMALIKQSYEKHTDAIE
jgi:uncharacterized protein with ParB-like and HNH nuclease domain/predicted transport protein